MICSCVCCFRNNRELTQKVLNILLNQDIEIESLDTQADIINISGSKSIRPDVFIVDTKGVHYDLEIQKDIYQLSNKRCRYYVDCLDVQYLKQGMDYDKLPKLYMICITEFDYFGKGKAIYEIKKTVKDIQELDYDDEVYILYVNGEYRGNDEIGLLMHDFSCSDFKDMYIDEMRESVKRAKTIEMEESDMCEALEKFRNKAIAEGMAQGIAQGISQGMAQGEAKGKLEEKEKTVLKLQR
ncbi:MAG: PD-(D/E)XK nuclease family transposase [Holdemanella porci]